MIEIIRTNADFLFFRLYILTYLLAIYLYLLHYRQSTCSDNSYIFVVHFGSINKYKNMNKLGGKPKLQWTTCTYQESERLQGKESHLLEWIVEQGLDGPVSDGSKPLVALLTCSQPYPQTVQSYLSPLCPLACGP